MEYLRAWAEENPDDKVIHSCHSVKCSREPTRLQIIVISQWTEALKLVSNYLVEHSIGHVK